MAKYKKKKSTENLPHEDKNQAVPSSLGGDSAASESSLSKKIAPGSITLQFAGDLILAKSSKKNPSGLFKRYSAIFEALANIEKNQRNLIYRFLAGLILTSYAKKVGDPVQRKSLFAQKNDLFINMANEPHYRRLFKFKYLVSKNFRVLKYCAQCIEQNTAENIEKHKWKYCKNCQVDHNFYNLLSMEVKFVRGWARLFLSNDQIPRLKGFKLPRKMKAGELKEEALFERYHYNVKNLDAIDLESTQALLKKLTSKI